MLRANRDVSIKSFAFYTYNVRNDWITIYKLRGGGNYTDPASVWDTVPIYNNYITYMGQTTLTTLGDFLNPVMITAGQVQSFYIVSRNYIMYNTATGNGEGVTPVSQDGALILYQGAGINMNPTKPFDSMVKSAPRKFKGKIRYAVTGTVR